MMPLVACVSWMATLIGVGMAVTALVNAVHERRERRRYAAVPLPPDPPLVSVLVPARNEARTIGPLLESLAAQDYPRYEVIVLDDDSTDGTGDRARAAASRSPRIRVLTGAPLAPGWIGKNHACDQLARAARGDWLLFTDADTVFAPGALTALMRRALARRPALLSGLPGLEAETFWERISVPMLPTVGLGLLCLPLAHHPSAPWWYSAASGACMLFERAAYERIGGHRAVRSHIVEDLALARRVRRFGLRVELTDVADLIRCRMYRSLREVWEGFTKNFRASFPGLWTPVAVAFLLGCFAWPPVAFVTAPWWGGGVWLGTVLPLVQMASTALARFLVDARHGRNGWLGALAMPLAAVFLSAIALHSAARHVLRRPTPWRDRRYELWRGEQVVERTGGAQSSVASGGSAVVQ